MGMGEESQLTEGVERKKDDSAIIKWGRSGKTLGEDLDARFSRRGDEKRQREGGEGGKRIFLRDGADPVLSKMEQKSESFQSERRARSHAE